MLFKPKKKHMVRGQAFIKYLKDCGVITDTDRVNHITIDVEYDGAVRIVVTKWGTLDLIEKKMPDLTDDPVTVEIVEESDNGE